LGRQTQQHDRLRGQREFVRILAEAGPLREVLTIEDAAYQYWILATPEIQRWRRRSCLRRWL